MLELKDLRIEYRKNPLGIDAVNPRFSWKLYSAEKNTMQSGYHIVVKSGRSIVWDSGEQESDASVCVKYMGAGLQPKTRYEVTVEAKDNHGETALAEGWFETGLMHCENMKADWITHGFEDDLEPCAVFYKKFPINGNVLSARLYASALGIYEFEMNGKEVTDVCFAPGWTSYQEHIQYQTYDITEALKKAGGGSPVENEIRFLVGNGWYKGILGFYNQGDHYGKRTALIAQMEIRYEDGRTELIMTDGSWTSTTGAHRYSELYHGEMIDYTIGEQESRPAQLYAHSKEVLAAQQDEPVRITQRIPGQELLITPQKEVVIDFGQNLAGVVEAHIKAAKGTKVVIRHAEALDENGNFYTANLRTAKATDTFICSGGEDVFRPKFTSHGFRYIAVEGLGEELNPADFTACVRHTDLEQTGFFECANEDVNRLWKNIDWTMRSNYLDIPTDCPQRDERLGYTGDAQLFLSTAVCHKNVALFFEKWLKDLSYEQKKENGAVPNTVPNILGSGGGMAIWHDAATVVPWTLYQVYGDQTFLEEQFESMVCCVEYSASMAKEDGLIKSGQQLGDWVALDVARGPMLKRTEEVWNLELIEKIGATDPYFVANVYYANSVHIVAEAAEVLGKKEEAEKYGKLYDEILQKIRDEYITKTGRLISETQTGCALALHFGIAEEKDRGKILNALKANLQQRKNHLMTGFAGTRILCKVLSENGAHDIAGSIFLKEDCPSWLYSVKLGATTIWELWDGVNPDGSFNKFEMNSLNQYAYASIGDWIFHDLCGLDMLSPGYKKSKIAPRMVKGIPEMKGSIETVYGTLACHISCLDHKYIVDIIIPENTTAEVALPERETEVLGSGQYHFEYETEHSFIKERYDRDSKFGELLENPVGLHMLQEYAKDLLANDLFLTFAKVRPVMELAGMLPPEAMGLIDLVIAQCNAIPADK